MSATAPRAPGADPAALRESLLEQLLAGAPAALCVAFSGGPDSTALLHLLAQLPEARDHGLRALHVDHGLHPDSTEWAARCASVCADLDIPLTTARVEVADDRGEGIEAAARRARRGAFAAQLQDGEWLALAHHRDDQVETVLLKLLRGAGPEGLGGMRALRRFAAGSLWRPLLEIPREMLRNYLDGNNFPFIDDPANQDPRFARNVLREEILPAMARHWPQAGASILHSAALCRVAAGYIDEAARTAVATLVQDDALHTGGWLALPEALRAPALEHWLHARGLPGPTTAQRLQIERQARESTHDSVPRVAWPGAEVRIWNRQMHAMAPLPPPPGNWRSSWDGRPLALPDGCGRLDLANPDGTDAATTTLPASLTVAFRRGGECIKPVGDGHTRELRDLFQQARIPPWLRERCPLIYLDDELIAVADWWASEHGKALFETGGVRPRWSRPAWAKIVWSQRVNPGRGRDGRR